MTFSEYFTSERYSKRQDNIYNLIKDTAKPNSTMPDWEHYWKYDTNKRYHRPENSNSEICRLTEKHEKNNENEKDWTQKAEIPERYVLISDMFVVFKKEIGCKIIEDLLKDDFSHWIRHKPIPENHLKELNPDFIGRLDELIKKQDENMLKEIGSKEDKKYKDGYLKKSLEEINPLGFHFNYFLKLFSISSLVNHLIGIAIHS